METALLWCTVAIQWAFMSCLLAAAWATWRRAVFWQLEAETATAQLVVLQRRDAGGGQQ